MMAAFESMMQMRKMEEDLKKSRKSKMAKNSQEVVPFDIFEVLDNNYKAIMKVKKNSSPLHKSYKNKTVPKNLKMQETMVNLVVDKVKRNSSSTLNKKGANNYDYILNTSSIKPLNLESKTTDDACKDELKTVKKNKKVIANIKYAPKRTGQKRKLAEVNVKEHSNNTNVKDLSKEHILQCISAIFHLNEEQLKNKKLLFATESQPIFMQVTCIRVPKVPRRQLRIVLPHSIVLPTDEVALIVGDLQKGRRRDYEPTIDHYRDILAKCGCTSIKDIIPTNQIKTEYDQFELKRRLVSSYDYFLVDGKIAGHVTHLLGKIFLQKRKLPTSIRMSSKDLNREIDLALKKTSMFLHSHGDTHVMQIGNTFMKKKSILENVLSACYSLCECYPGGWANIRSIRLKSHFTLSLPIYITLKSKNDVCVPDIKAKRPKAYRTVEGELTTLKGDANVIVTPEGDVRVVRTHTRTDDDVSDQEEQ